MSAADTKVETPPEAGVPPGADRTPREVWSADETARIRLGGGRDTPPELLFFLAHDRSLAVRASVAMNDATPPQVHRRLAHDPDERVRVVLARKLASLAPGLPPADQARLSQHAWDNLAIMVQDAAERVRQVVAELVSHMPDAPRDLILRLARDTSFPVSDPVLRLSPLLTEADLLSLLGCNPAGSAAPALHAAQSIARRVDVTEEISDAIVRTANTAAIAALLSNASASIRETTLDALVSRAADRAEWHEPLVRRPALSAVNARLLASIVADHLVQVLVARPDLDPALTQDLREGLRRRLAQVVPAPEERSGERLLAEARSLEAAGGLSESALIEAIRHGQSERLAAMIAVAAGVPLPAVQRAAKLRSAKAIVSLVWKAGFSMRIAGPVQALLGNMTPSTVLRATVGGGFPLGEEEMRWQLEFVTHR